MDIDRYGWVRDGEIPFIEVGGMTFHGLPGDYPQMFDAIVQDIDIRFHANRPNVQHKYYDYQAEDVVVEVGAYLGFYAMNTALKVEKLLAIEMIPELYKIMNMNLAPFPHATTAMKGVGDRQGVGVARKGDRQGSSLRADVADAFSSVCEDVKVELDTLDNILDENDIDMVDMLIVQVNGSEIEVLEGLTLDRVRNFAIAIPYNDAAVVGNLLDGFETTVDKVVIYGRALPEN